MRKIICLTLMAIVVHATSLMAQPGGEKHDGQSRKEKVEALKRSYYSEKLELTPAEAEKFWPIYNEFSKKEDEMRKSARGEKKKDEVPNFTEKEALAEIERSAQAKKSHIDLETQFLKDCMPVLGPNRTMRLSKLDHEFQRELLQHMRERKEGGGGGKGPKK